MSRIDNAARNIKYGYLGNVVTILLRFASRTVFIYTIGVTYLGVNGLYTSVLSVLSLAELGLGSAMNYSFYKPVAVNDKEKIKSLIFLYKRAYLLIILVITILGLLLVPFLPTIIKEPGSITSNELIIYYLIFLFNTVSTYFVSYKYSLVNAEQRNYIQTNIHLIRTIITTVIQMIVLFLFHSFLLYLLVAAVVGLIEKIFANRYINKLYPYLLEKNIKPLTKEETVEIKKNVKALIFHKIGEISVHQTDNILISAFINITTVGLVSNYTLIISSVTKFTVVIFNSTISGIGNLIATENKEKQFFLFKAYRLLGFWVYGFATIAFLFLISPFIQLWIGPERVIADIVVWLIMIDYYVKGHRIVVNNFKIAAGIFDDDKYVAISQAIVNLVVSITMVKIIGLPGIYIGTVVQGLVSTFSRPIIIFNKVFKKSAKLYYKDSIVFILVLACPIIILSVIKSYIMININIKSFIIMMLFVALIPNVIFYCAFKNRAEFQYLKNIVVRKLRKKI